MKNKYKNIIVGAGLSGAVMAERLASVLGEEVLVVDKRDHIAGNCFDYIDNNGICVHKYGPHIFHTEMKHVWDYLSKFTNWNYYFFKPQVVIDGKPVTLPFNLNSIDEVFPKNLAIKLTDKLIDKYGYNKKISILDLKKEKDKDLQFLADFVYKKVFEGYTTKQWGLGPEEIDSSVTARVPVYISRDNRYFQDKYQGIPIRGYTSMIEKILDNKNIHIQLNTEFASIKDSIEYERIFFTGAIDEFFDYKFGELPYRSLKFDIVKKDCEFFQETAMVNYPNDYDFTRITEHKYFLGTKSNRTTISIEYPQAFKKGENERYYPISNKNNEELYQEYLKEAQSLTNTYFLGRLGDYKYYNMDLTIDRALKLFEEVK